MKKLLLSAVTVCLLGATPLLAADLPYKALPPPPIFNWSGFYIGGQAGGGWSDTDWTNLVGTHFFTAIGQRDSFSASGFLGGGQIGLNYQAGMWVLGVEAAVVGGNLEDTVVRPGPFSANTLNNKISAIYTISGRLGVAWDRLLVYAKAGFAGARVSIRAGEEPFFPHFLQDSRRHNGYVIGVGGEYQFLPNWIFGVEYNYIDLGAKNHTGVDNIAFNPSYTIRVDPSVHTIMARLSYLIPFGGPVRAGY